MAKQQKAQASDKRLIEDYLPSKGFLPNRVARNRYDKDTSQRYIYGGRVVHSSRAA